MVRILANDVWQTPLYEINLFKTTDISDLLGSFEQINLESKVTNCILDLKYSLNEYISSLSKTDKGSAEILNEFDDPKNTSKKKYVQKLFSQILNIEFLIKSGAGLATLVNNLEDLVSTIENCFFKADNPIFYQTKKSFFLGTDPDNSEQYFNSLKSGFENL
jgi:hypothetical protein